MCCGVSDPPRFDASRALLLTGSPRSGTTWLGTLLASARGYCQLTEPLFPGLPGRREAGISLRTYVPPEQEWPAGQRLFLDCLEGRDLTPQIWIDNPPGAVETATAVVFQAVRANRLLPWIARHLPFRGMVYLVRHPCAVVSSQILHPAFEAEDAVPDHDLSYVERVRPDLLPLLETIRSEMEIRALRWSLDQHLPLTMDGGWLRVSYEELVLEGPGALRRLFERLGLEPGPRTAELFGRNSRSAGPWSAGDGAPPELRLGGWRERLTSAQIDSILRVVEACGVRGFGPEPVPTLPEGAESTW